MGWKIFWILFFSILLINFVYAEFVFSDIGSSINTEYGTSDYLKAKINISFQNESLGSSFQDSLGNSINLTVLLTKIPNFDFSINYESNSITAVFHVIPFDDANFSMPSTIGNFTYNLNFSGETIFSGEIKIISAEKPVEQVILEKYGALDDLKNEIKKFDFSIQSVLNKELNMSSIENQLGIIENQYETSSPEQYDAILQNLSEINLPEGIREITTTNPINFYSRRENINLDAVKSIAGGDYAIEKESGYIDAVYLWNQENLVTDLTFKEIAVIYETDGIEGETIIRIFNFEFDKRNLENPAYFIIEDLGDIKFYGNYSENENNGYLYISLSDISDQIMLSTRQEVNFLNVPAFISPSLNDLTPVEVGDYTSATDEKKFSKWFLFGLILTLLILIGVVSYIALQIWYRRRYENYLFKDRNNLFNIMNYIQTAKKKGMPREKIINNLRKANWRKEQINYAMNKYEGKKIAGIIERPFKKVLESVEKSKKKEPTNYHTKV
ncbi:MAG: hypothetical protein ABIE36_02520 [Candidatus Diapherotrites archaeon]